VTQLTRQDGPVSLEALKRRLIGKRSVKIGFPQGPTEKDGTPVAMIAAVHEFGAPSKHIPERSFLRSSIAENMPKYMRLNRASLVRIIHGKATPGLALGLLGEMAAGDAKKLIRNGNFVPLSPATIRAKGSDKPLIDTGTMLQTLTYKVDP
jgi:hypothetical protein